MDAGATSEMTLGEGFIWVSYIFNYTDEVAAAIPEELLNWRPQDPTGGYHFSLAEIVMHIADGRRRFASELSGSDETANYWSPGHWGCAPEGGDEPSGFKAYGGKQELLDSLGQARALYAPYLALPLSSMGQVSEGARVAFERLVAALKEAGEGTDVLERRGPPSVAQVLLAAVAHESGHRGTLYTLLRLNGVYLPEE